MIIAFILGTRPEIIKLAPLVRRFAPEERCVIWTGQHYSPELTNAWEGAGFEPDINICSFQKSDWVVCDGTAAMNDARALAYLTGQLTVRLSIMVPSRPLWVVVQGDTTSALAGALAASKLGLRVWHVEAGSRSGDRSQPEELNRILIDHCASGWSYSYPQDGENLRRDGVGYRDLILQNDFIRTRVLIDRAEGTDDITLPHGVEILLESKHLTNCIYSGEILIDAIQGQCATPEPNGGIVATIHRAETVENPEVLEQVVLGLIAIGGQHEKGVTLFCHPHTRKKLESISKGTSEFTTRFEPDLHIVDPVSPDVFRWALRGAAGCITDSGGVAVEAAYFGVPTLIARDYCEFKDLINCGRLVLGGRTCDSLTENWKRITRNAPLSPEVESSWQGNAAEKIAEALRR